MIKALFLLILSMISYGSFAAEWKPIMILSWGQVYKNQATVFLNWNKDDLSAQQYSASIQHSTSGNQNIYIMFRFNFKNNFNACDPTKDIADSIAKFNGKAVKVFAWCQKFDDSNKYFLYFTPMTDAGKNYVVNQFKRSPDYVWIEYSDFKVGISAKGFTAVWNNYGGNAI